MEKMSLKLIRIARLKEFALNRGLVGPVALGAAIGKKTNQTSDLLSGKASFGEKVARSIEECASLPANWLDSLGDAGNQSKTITQPIQDAAKTIATLEQITEALAGYLMQMDDDARDDAGDVLRKLAHKPENHARAAAMLTTAFHSGKRKAA